MARRHEGSDGYIEMFTQHLGEGSTKPFACNLKFLELLTDDFKDEYLIGPTQFGKLYRGKIKPDPNGSETRDVTVKIWDEKSYAIDDNRVVDDEVIFLSHPSVVQHPNLVKLIAYCRSKPVKGVVYDLNPLDSLYNYTLKDDFTWIQRIRVALGFAHLLEFLHSKEEPYVVFNIDATHIMLDQACNPILCDFGLTSGGIIGERFGQQFAHMSPGYADPHYERTWKRQPSCDVFSYGVILLGLIAKRIDNKEDIAKTEYRLMHQWAHKMYEAQNFLVHSSLVESEDYDMCDGHAITKLAMSCIQPFSADRPRMDKVVACLEDLRAVKLRGDKLVAGEVYDTSDLKKWIYNFSSLYQKIRSVGIPSNCSSFDCSPAEIQSKDRGSTKPFSCNSKFLELLTDSFSDEYLIGPTQFGKLYRGKIKPDPNGEETRDVTVKIWDDKVDIIDDDRVVDEEVRFLSHASVIQHPNLVKLIAFCREEPVKGVVYDLNPLDSLYNYTLKDDFTWIQRIKVALEFARFLEFLHGQEKPYLVFNIDTIHIMLDQAGKPILVDFGLISGGIMGEMRFSQRFAYMSPGYFDMDYVNTGVRHTCCDVFSYGCILLGLIAKRIDSTEDMTNIKHVMMEDWAHQMYNSQRCLVHSSLEEEEGYDVRDGHAITKLAMLCVQPCGLERPTMKDVVESLEGLCVVQLRGYGLGLHTHKDKIVKLGM